MKGEITRAIVQRYILFQIPALVIAVCVLYFVHSFFELPFFVVWGGMLLWMAKDAVMFPLVWKSYDADSGKAVHSMTGKRGIAKGRLDPEGYVSVGIELWKAETSLGCPAIEKGKTVTVTGMKGLRLIVVPEEFD